LLTALVGFVVACAAAPVHPSLRACASFGLRAIKRHEVVSVVPPACAGLTKAQVNQAVGIAIREAVGPQPKAAGRHLAFRDGRYLAPLVSRVPPSPSAAVGTSSTSKPPAAQLTWSALACWFATAAVGAYLLFGQSWHRHRHRRDRRPATAPPRVALAHAAVALTGLAICIAFAITGAAALGWTAAALVAAAAGLGMASLVTFLPEPVVGPPRSDREGSGWTRSLVFTVIGHGLLATVTMLLVVLAAISRS